MPIPFANLQSLSPGALIELFELDATAQGGSVSRFHAGTNGVGSDIVWQGVTYAKASIRAEGFEISAKGVLPRPQLVISNLFGTIGLLIENLDDLIGATVTRKKTYAMYLDGMPDADPTQELDDDIFEVERKVSESREAVQFELASKLDAHGQKAPARVMQATVCWWNDAAICPYSVGGVCDKTIEGATGCKFHYGANARLPFGGFPGTSRIR